MNERISAMLHKQRTLATKYHSIVTNNGHFHPDFSDEAKLPVDIDNPHVQAWIKSTLYCVFEELFESEVEVFVSKKGHGDFDKSAHELIDALHFLLELIVAIGPSNVMPLTAVELPMTKVGGMPSKLIDQLNWCRWFIARAGYNLKNRPWKQTMKPTNRDQFYIEVRAIWHQLMMCFSVCGWNIEQVYEAYMSKHKENQQRQNTGY